MGKSLLNILKEIETTYPVNEIRINGQQVWPYLRVYYYSAYQTKIATSYGEDEYIKQQLGGQRLTRMLRIIITLLREIPLGFKNWFRKYEYIALTNNSFRRQIDGKYFNPFLDPVIDEIGPDRVLCMEYAWQIPHYPVDNIYTKHIVFISLLEILSQLIRILRKIFLKRHNIVNKHVLDTIDADYSLNIDAMRRVDDFEAKRTVYYLFFCIMRPRAVWVAPYNAHLPAVRAAKDLGIKVLEASHGFIVKENPAYTISCDIDRSCFPDYLLVCGKQERSTFDNPRFIDPVNVHPVGSFFIDYAKAMYRPEAHLSNRLASYKQIISTTLGWSFEKSMITFICEAAKLDDSIFYILIPRWAQNPAYSSIELPSNVEMIVDKNFYELMVYTDFHSTLYSTCAIEAPALGVQNILLDIGGQASDFWGAVLKDTRVTRFVDTPERYVDTINSFPKLDRATVCKLHEDFFATNYKENIRNFVKTYLL